MKKIALFLIFLFMVFQISQAQDQEWYKYYNDAQKAMKVGQWQKAIDALRTCARKRPKPKRRAETYSHFYIKYFPYYSMAKANYHLGKFDVAAEMIKMSLSFGEIKKDPDYRSKLEKLNNLVTKAIAESKKPQPSKIQEENKKLLADGKIFYQRGQLGAAKKIFTQLSKSKKDPEIAYLAKLLLKNIMQEENDWANANRFLKEGKYENALSIIQTIAHDNGVFAKKAKLILPEVLKKAKEAKRLLRKEQSLKSSLDVLDTMIKNKQFDSALAMLDTLENKYGKNDQILNKKESLSSGILDSIDSFIDRKELKKATTLCNLASKYNIATDRLASRKSIIMQIRDFEKAKTVFKQGRLSAAKALTKKLLKSPRFSKQATQLLARIKKAEGELERSIKKINRLVTISDIATAYNETKILKKQFPQSLRVAELNSKILQLRLKQGLLKPEEYLKNGLKEFFDHGDYQRAVFFFDEYMKRKGKKEELAHFFKAICFIYLNYLSPSKSDEYLKKAQQEAVKIPDDFIVSSKWISRKALKLLRRLKNKKFSETF